MSARLVVSARIAMISLATAMSKPVTRVTPFSSGPWPMVIWRSMRSLVSSTRRQVMLSRIDIQAREAAALFRRQLVGIGLRDAELLAAAAASPAKIAGCRPSLAGTSRSNSAVVVCGAFVEHARIDRRGQQIIRGGDRVNVAGEVEIELLHRE